MKSHIGSFAACSANECSRILDDGRWHHKFHQSWLGESDICLERARRDHTKEGWEDFESDAPSIGTSVHAAIEGTLIDFFDFGSPPALSTTLDMFNDKFSELMAMPDFRWVKYTEAQARKFGTTCTTGWYREVLPTLPDHAQLEMHFDLPFIDDGERTVDLAGTIDYLGVTLKDWKTASRGEYVEWEKRRWAIQPTVYTWAAHELGLVDELEWPSDAYGEENGVPFEYVVMHDKGVQRFTVYRGHDDWSFLRHKVINLAKLIEADLDAWPLNDNQALCSKKWCPAWDNCKGSHGIEF